jgi:hypothetical protein
MNALNKGLVLAAILLCGSTIYLAWRVGEERGRSPPALSMEMTASAGPGMARNGADESEPAAATSGAATDKPVAGPPAATPPGRRGRAPREVEDAIGKQMLELAYKDPATRRELVEELVPDLRDEYLILERRLKLGNTRWQEFLETLAAQEIDRRAQTADCGRNDACLRRVLSTAAYAQKDQALRAFLGDADHQVYGEFVYSLQERRGVVALQRRLPLPQRLSDDATEALISALSEVRREAEAEISAVGGTATSILFADAPRVILPHGLERTEDRLAYVLAYSRRLRKSAATVLTGVQLARFHELQDAMLLKMRRQEQQLVSAPPRSGA